MKRIYNDIPVESILYTIGGLQRVKIIDYPTQYDCSNCKNGTVVFDGLVKDTYGYKLAKYTEAKVYETRIEDDALVFDVFTKYEEYK